MNGNQLNTVITWNPWNQWNHWNILVQWRSMGLLNCVQWDYYRLINLDWMASTINQWTNGIHEQQQRRQVYIYESVNDNGNIENSES